jgi:hypothetical protein
MIIENNILEISKALFKDKDKWKYVTDEQKEQFFFIFNRFFSKKHPQMSQLLNDKSINKIVGLDLWFNYFLDKPYPQWFWSKSPKSNSEGEVEEIYKLKQIFDLKDSEFDFLIKNFSDEIQEELDYIKKQNDGNNAKKLVHGKGTK